MKFMIRLVEQNMLLNASLFEMYDSGSFPELCITFHLHYISFALHFICITFHLHLKIMPHQHEMHDTS